MIYPGSIPGNTSLVYIAGYVQCTIIKKEECIDCKIFLANMNIVESSLLKNQRPLCIPSAEVVKVVKVTHSLIEKRIHEPDLLSEKNFVEKLTIKTVCFLNSLYPSLLDKLTDYADSCSVTNNHEVEIIKKINLFYIYTVFQYFCQQRNNKDIKIRNIQSLSCSKTSRKRLLTSCSSKCKKGIPRKLS
jgi:hypothetical protein